MSTRRPSGTWSKTDRWVLIMVALNCMAVFYAASIFRPLVGEGAPWMFMGLAERAPAYDSAFARYFHIIWQLLGLALDRAGFSTRTVLLTHMYMSSIANMISLAASYWILKHKKRLDLFVFPLLVFALVGTVLMIRPFDLVTDVVALAFPLALLSLLGPIGRVEWALVVLLAIALVFSHETSIGILLTLGVLNCVDIFLARRRPGASSAVPISPALLQAALFFAGSACLSYRIWGPNAGESAHFVAQMKALWALSSVAAAALTPLFALALLAGPHFVARWKRTFLLGTCAVLSLALCLMLDRAPWKLVTGARTARVFAIPQTALWIAIMFCYLRFYCQTVRSTSEHEEEAEKLTFIRALVAIFLFFTLWQDIEGSRNWKIGYTNLKEIISTPGCREFRVDELYWKLARYGIFQREVPAMSALISKIEFGEVRAIVGSRDSRAQVEESVCCTIYRESIPVYSGRFRLPDRTAFDLSNLMSGLRESDFVSCAP